MTKTARRKFVAKLRFLAKELAHDQLATLIGIERTILRNWLYRDTPTAWRIEKIEPTVNRLYQEKKVK